MKIIIDPNDLVFGHGGRIDFIGDKPSVSLRSQDIIDSVDLEGSVSPFTEGVNVYVRIDTDDIPAFGDKTWLDREYVNLRPFIDYSKLAYPDDPTKRFDRIPQIDTERIIADETQAQINRYLRWYLDNHELNHSTALASSAHSELAAQFFLHFAKFPSYLAEQWNHTQDLMEAKQLAIANPTQKVDLDLRRPLPNLCFASPFAFGYVSRVIPVPQVVGDRTAIARAIFHPNSKNFSADKGSIRYADIWGSARTYALHKHTGNRTDTGSEEMTIEALRFCLGEDNVRARLEQVAGVLTDGGLGLQADGSVDLGEIRGEGEDG